MLRVGLFIIWKCVGGAYICVLYPFVACLYVSALLISMMSGVVLISEGSFDILCCSVCVCGSMFSLCVFV